MLKRYVATGLCTTGTNKTALHLAGASTVRAAIYDAFFSSASTPADVAIRVAIQRITAVGTEGSAVVPAPLDSADPASLIDAGENHSAEPTYTSATEMFDQSFNQRATLRWVAVPGGELIIPATAANGFGFKSLAVSSGTPQMEVTAHWQE